MLNFPALLLSFGDGASRPRPLQGMGRLRQDLQRDSRALQVVVSPLKALPMLSSLPSLCGDEVCAACRTRGVSDALRVCCVNRWHSHVSWPWVLGSVAHPACG